MPTHLMFGPPNLPTIEVTTEFTGNTHVDSEFGGMVQEERVISVFARNQTPFRWTITIYQGGSEVFSGNVVVGYNNTVNLPNPRRFIFDQYSACVSRQ